MEKKKKYITFDEVTVKGTDDSIPLVCHGDLNTVTTTFDRP
jgi:hypothetical protein